MRPWWNGRGQREGLWLGQVQLSVDSAPVEALTAKHLPQRIQNPNKTHKKFSTIRALTLFNFSLVQQTDKEKQTPLSLCTANPTRERERGKVSVLRRQRRCSSVSKLSLAHHILFNGEREGEEFCNQINEREEKEKGFTFQGRPC